MLSRMRCWVLGETGRLPDRAFETVPGETLAWRATSLIFAIDILGKNQTVFINLSHSSIANLCRLIYLAHNICSFSVEIVLTKLGLSI